MTGRRGSWWALGLLNLPFLVLARSGLFGPDARDEAGLALADLAGYAKFLLALLALIVIVLFAAVAYSLH